MPIENRPFYRVARWAAVATLGAILFFGAVEMAQGQNMSVCLPHADAITELKESYNEVPRGLGVGQRGFSVVELFVSPEGTWTVLITGTNGMSCIGASGDTWRFVSAPEVGFVL